MPNCERCPRVQAEIESSLNNIPDAVLFDQIGNFMLDKALEETKDQVTQGCVDGTTAIKVPRKGPLGVLGVKRSEHYCTNPLLTSKQPQ